MSLRSSSSVFSVILGVLTIYLNTSCALAKRLRKKDFKENASERFVIHGDPLELVKGASFNRTPVLTMEDLDNPAMKSWSTSISVFTEKAKRLPDRSLEEIKDENSTSDESSESDGATLEFILVRCEITDECDAKLFAKRESNVLELHFVANNLNQLALKGVGSSSGVSNDLEVLHYSINPERNHFSILFTTDDEDGKNLFSVDLNRKFSMTGLPSVSKVSTEYDYLAGEGIRMYWPGEIKLSLCDSDTDDREKLVRYAKDWETTDGKIGEVRYNISENYFFPPFSDVNTHCLMVADTYVVNDRDSEVVLGRTHFSSVDATSQLIGASVVIFEKSHDQVCSPECGTTGYGKDELLAGTIRHEVGHALGLGHEFSKDAFGLVKHASVMGYDNQMTITAYDREALSELYRDRSLVEVQNGILAACQDARKHPNKPAMVKYLSTDGESYWSLRNDQCEENVSLALSSPKVLRLNRTKLNTLEGVKYFDFVKRVEIRDGMISDLSPLSQLSGLESLDVSTYVESYIKVCPSNSTPVLSKYCTSLKAKLNN